MPSETTTKHINLGKRPDLMIRLEMQGIIPKGNPEGPHAGCAIRWSEESAAPYDNPRYQAMAARLPEGWEDVTEEEWNDLMSRLGEAIEKKKQTKMQSVHLGNRQLLKQLLQMTLLGLTTAAALVEKSKFAWLPQKEKGDLIAAEKFAYILFIQLALELEIVPQMLRAFAEGAGLNEEQQNIMIDTMELFTLLAAIKTASLKDRSYGIAITEQFQEELLRGIGKVQAVLNDARTKEKLPGPIPNGVALYLQQGKLALEKGDFAGFYQAYEGALGLLGITEEDFSRDLEGIREFAERIVYACTLGTNDQTNNLTGITQA